MRWTKENVVEMLVDAFQASADEAAAVKSVYRKLSLRPGDAWLALGWFATEELVDWARRKHWLGAPGSNGGPPGVPWSKAIEQNPELVWDMWWRGKRLGDWTAVDVQQAVAYYRGQSTFYGQKADGWAGVAVCIGSGRLQDAMLSDEAAEFLESEFGQLPQPVD